MATVTVTSVTNTSISRTLAYENNDTHLREASFSSYLNGTEEVKCIESMVKPSTIRITPQEPMYQESSERKKIGYGEIGVFGAEKYFNGIMDKDETITANKNGRKCQPKNVHGMKPKTSIGTPSTCSEASWNSRSALLPVLQSRQDKANGKNFFSALGCKCYCSDNKSVDVDQKILDNKNNISPKKKIEGGEIHGKVMATLPIEINRTPNGMMQIKKPPPSSWFKEEIPGRKLEKGSNGHSEDCFTLSAVGKASSLSKSEKVEDEKARESLEVFGSPVMEKEDIALNLEKRLAMLTWDANPKVENAPIVPIVRSVLSDDIDSDSSSDLFEIKSLSSNGHPFFRRQASDGMSGCMSPSYEPSEASIDWSVVTASAANFSVASDYDESKSVIDAKNRELLKPTAMITTPRAKTEMSKDTGKRRPSMLLGCRSQKAVKVVGGAHRLPEKKSEFSGQLKLNTFTPRSRFQVESKVTDLESAHTQHALAIGPLSQLNSVRTTDSLYMH